MPCGCTTPSAWSSARSLGEAFSNWLVCGARLVAPFGLVVGRRLGSGSDGLTHCAAASPSPACPSPLTSLLGGDLRPHTSPLAFAPLRSASLGFPSRHCSSLTAAHTKTDVYRNLGRAGKTLFEGGSKGITIERFNAVDVKGKL